MWRFRQLLSLATFLTMAGQTLADEQSLLQIIAPDREMNVAAESIVDASMVANAHGDLAVLVRVDAVQAREFGQLTQANIGQIVKVFVCGELVLEPMIQTPILGGSLVLSNPDTQVVQRIFAALQSGKCTRDDE